MLLLPEAAQANYCSNTSTKFCGSHGGTVYTQSTGTCVTGWLCICQSSSGQVGQGHAQSKCCRPPVSAPPCGATRVGIHTGGPGTQGGTLACGSATLHRVAHAQSSVGVRPMGAALCGNTRESVSQGVQELKTGRWCVVRQCIAYQKSAPQSKFKTVYL
jgi:hypothetical protein